MVKYDPIPEDNQEFKDKFLAPQIKKYYKFNKVSRFQQTRTFKKETKKYATKEGWHEFASLWTRRTIETTRYLYYEFQRNVDGCLWSSHLAQS